MKNDQRGFAHLLMLLMLVGAISLACFIGWRVWHKQSASISDQVPGSSQGAGGKLSKLHVSGNHIVNKAGQEVRLRGVNFEDPFLLEHDRNKDGPLVDHFAQVESDYINVKKLGANVVRLTLYPGFYWLVGGDKYLSTYVDRMVNLADKNGLYVIISYHAIGRPGGWYESSPDTTIVAEYPAKIHYTDSDMAVAFWNKVASRYGQKNHVIFEMYNEPADETASFTWADWRPTGELLAATIRKHSDNLILGPGPKYTSDLSDVPKNPYSDSNIAYVAHIYPNTVPEGDQVAQWEALFGFLTKTYPVIVTEWGFHDGGKDPTTKGTLAGFGKPLIDYLDQKNLSWVATCIILLMTNRQCSKTTGSRSMNSGNL
jgi:hypothetical protein